MTKYKSYQCAESLHGSTSATIDWYAEGDAREIDIGGVTILVQYLGRKARRARIKLVAPSAAVFNQVDGNRAGRD